MPLSGIVNEVNTIEHSCANTTASCETIYGTLAGIESIRQINSDRTTKHTVQNPKTLDIELQHTLLRSAVFTCKYLLHWKYLRNTNISTSPLLVTN